MTILILAIGSANGESIQIDTGDVDIVDGFSLAAFWSERESRPEMAAPLTDDEAAELDAQAEGDPNYQRWVAEGSPSAGFTWTDSETQRREYRQRPVNWPVI